MKRAIPVILAGWVLATSTAFSVRLKDLAVIRGVRENQLLGYGMVAGLPSTGDRGGDFTEASLNQALRGLGVDLKTQKIGTKNTAAVVVSATLRPFARVGSHLDVVVSSIGSASSLDGGTLLMTPLKGADGKTYAIAQGRIVVAKRTDRSQPVFQASVAAQIPAGALLEKEVPVDFSKVHDLHYQLHQPDFTTAARIAQRINEELSGKYATAVDPGTVDLILPYGIEESVVDLVAKIESVDIEPDHLAKVIINRHTGTVVLGDNVRIFPASIAHNNIRIQIKEEGRDPSSTPAPPKPQPVAVAQNGAPSDTPDPNATPAAEPSPERQEKQLMLTNRSASIGDIVVSLNDIGASADDLVFLLQALKSAGALMADLEME
jgi:flagellar P-ring protein FlgI